MKIPKDHKFSNSGSCMLNRQPLISIITVTYNAASSIRQTIDSVQAQTFKNFEHIIIDGKSTDDTVSIIGEYADKIAQFVSEPDSGIYDAMNKGLQLARGEWVMFLNAGDYLHSLATLQGLAAGLKGNVDLIYSDFICDYGRFRKIIITPEAQDIKAAIGNGMCICHNATVFRTALHRSKPYDIRYRIAADFDVILDMVEQGAVLAKCPEPICTIETGAGVSYRRQIDSLLEHRRVIKVHGGRWLSLFHNTVAISLTAVRMLMKTLLPKTLADLIIRYK